MIEHREVLGGLHNCADIVTGFRVCFFAIPDFSGTLRTFAIGIVYCYHRDTASLAIPYTVFLDRKFRALLILFVACFAAWPCFGPLVAPLAPCIPDKTTSCRFPLVRASSAVLLFHPLVFLSILWLLIYYNGVLAGYFHQP